MMALRWAKRLGLNADSPARAGLSGLTRVGGLLLVLCLGTLAWAVDLRYAPFPPGKWPPACPLKALENTAPTTGYRFQPKGASIRLDIDEDADGNLQAQLVRSANGQPLSARYALTGSTLGFDGAFSAELSPDGRPDLLIVQRSGGAGLAAGYAWLTVFVSQGDRYVVSSIESYDPAPHDWLKPGRAKHCQLIQTTPIWTDATRDGRAHSFWVYQLLDFAHGQPRYVNQARAGFPLWVDYRYKASHRATRKLSAQQKQAAWAKRDFGHIGPAKPAATPLP
ncbi:hypothetical protein SAMN02745887_00525 [Chitinimonas taiwanensis DSM 18899]|uniref:Uncharacterized protein n=2 Tax=Chitinimonas TaxID=240411 RepID=A0A1K2H856_9NEIS|nr:hypothetical protein SAMN02745887_00525 [Chitinimonas taiwanensis DSM 18899]